MICLTWLSVIGKKVTTLTPARSVISTIGYLYFGCSGSKEDGFEAFFLKLSSSLARPSIEATLIFCLFSAAVRILLIQSTKLAYNCRFLLYSSTALWP